jgi:hypothetical protein
MVGGWGVLHSLGLADLSRALVKSIFDNVFEMFFDIAKTQSQSSPLKVLHFLSQRFAA